MKGLRMSKKRMIWRYGAMSLSLWTLLPAYLSRSAFPSCSRRRVVRVARSPRCSHLFVLLLILFTRNFFFSRCSSVHIIHSAPPHLAASLSFLMSLHTASSGLVYDAFTSPTSSPVKSKRRPHTSPPKSFPVAVIDNPPKDAIVKPASSPTFLPILDRVVEHFPLQERAHRQIIPPPLLTAATTPRHRGPILSLRGRVQRP